MLHTNEENDVPNEENGSQNEDIDHGWVLTSAFWDFKVVKKAMGSCTTQYKMLQKLS